MKAALPDPYPVHRAAGVSGVVEPPGSKSISHRALNLALIGRQPATIENLLEADDIAAFRAALVAMGWRVRSVAGSGLRVEPGQEDGAGDAVRLDCRSAGTLLRLLVASCAVTPGKWILDGSPRLRERPIGPLVAALRQLGAGIEELGRPGCAPVRIRGGRLSGGRVEIDAGESSQYVSALLMAALNAEGPIELLAPVLVSSPYVDTTLEVMADFGAPVEVRRDGEAREFRVEPRKPELVDGRYRVAGDDSAAAYPAAAAAICGGSVRLRGLAPASTQGDRAFLGLLERMGATVQATGREIRVEGGGALTAGRLRPLGDARPGADARRRGRVRRRRHVDPQRGAPEDQGERTVWPRWRANCAAPARPSTNWRTACGSRAIPVSPPRPARAAHPDRHLRRPPDRDEHGPGGDAPGRPLDSASGGRLQVLPPVSGRTSRRSGDDTHSSHPSPVASTGSQGARGQPI